MNEHILTSTHMDTQVPISQPLTLRCAGNSHKVALFSVRRDVIESMQPFGEVSQVTRVHSRATKVLVQPLLHRL
jgi:hypothetical protein